MFTRDRSVPAYVLLMFTSRVEEENCWTPGRAELAGESNQGDKFVQAVVRSLCPHGLLADPAGSVR